MNGDQQEKNQWTFKLIDFKKRGFFDFADFQSLIKVMVGTWAFMTGNQISTNLNSPKIINFFFII